MKARKISILRLMLAMLLIVGSGIDARAWDSDPDENGLYDEHFDRPTHFPEWSQPSTWPNAMFIVCDVRLGDVLGPQVPSYEIAVYDKDDKLRYCNRSLPKSNNIAVLTVRGEDGVDEFHFKVLYGDDFANPIVVDVPDLKVKFKTNQELGSPSEPLILVVPGRTYLRETDTQAPVAKTSVDVTVMRTITADEWGTICLPFAMTEQQVKTAFGDDVLLGDFIGCETTFEADGETVQRINVKFNAATAIVANHPYIIKVSQDITEFEVDGVDIIALGEGEQPSVDCDELRFGSGTTRDPYRYIYNSFIGNYISGILIPDQKLFLGGGKFWYSRGKTPLMAFRAYFDFYDVLPEASAQEAGVRMMITFDDNSGEPSSIHQTSFINRLEESGVWYDMSGRKIANRQPASRQLQKGLYISNGHKYMK